MAKSVFDLLYGIKILSQNVRSFNVSAKNFKPAKAKLLSMLDKNPDIMLLSECKLSSYKAKLSIERFLKLSKAGTYLSFFNSTSASRGTAIIIKNSIFDTVEMHYKCPYENSLIVKAKKGAFRINLVCLYLSNNPSDFITTFNNLPIADLTIFGGDFNIVLCSELLLSENLDLKGRATFPNFNVHTAIKNALNKYNFRDFFRFLNPVDNSCSYKDRKGESRLDYVCGNALLTPYIHKIYYKKLNHSFDHKACILCFKTTKGITKPRILRDIYKKPCFTRIAKSNYISAAMNARNITSTDNATLHDFFNLNYKLSSIEKFLIQKEDYFLNFNSKF